MRADMSGTSQKSAVSSGRSPCAPRKSLPMSERQQLALVMQMCASDKSASAASSNVSGGTSVTSSQSSSGTTGTGSPPAAGLSPSGASSSTAVGSASRSSRSARNERNERGETPLHLAAIRGDVALTRRLLSRGADPNCVDFAGWSPLHEASNRGRLQVAEWLLRAGANVNAQGFDADTPLHDAAVNGHVELVELLLRHGADQHQKNRRGQSPREVASPRVISCFLQHEQDNNKGSSGEAATSRPTVQEDLGTAASSAEALKAESEGVTETDSVTAAVEVSSHPTPITSAFDQTTPRSGASAGLCEMRRAPAQNKVDKTGSPRVTLRLHQVKGRDDKRSSQQQKGTDASSYETRLQFSISMDQGNKGDDVYEFKSSKDATPITGSPPDTDGNKSTAGAKDAGDTREQSSTSPGGRAGTPGSPGHKEESNKDLETAKRGASEMDGVEEADEENKRKKRKEDKSESKESTRNVGGSGRSTGRIGTDKSGKNSSIGSKNNNGKSSLGSSTISGSASLGDRKSPSNTGSAGNSPKAPPSKPSSAQGDSESDGDDGKKDAVSGSGPKVPPLKIVIPQQSSVEQEQGTRNGKNGNGRHQALPYVVTSSNDSEQGTATEKMESSASCGGLSKDEKKDAATLQEERSQRVLRSSHRSSNHGGGMGGAGMGGGGSSSSSSSLPMDSMANSPSPSKSDDKQEVNETASVDVHPRKRKIKANKESSVESSSDPPSSHTDVHPHDQPITNCYEMFLNIRKQIDRRRKGLFPVQPKPPQGFKDYLMNKCTYVLASNASSRQVQMLQPPPGLAVPMRELFSEQEKERYRLCLQHVIEKEKLVLSVEQEILRVHGRAARALANQSLPFSVCTILKDEEVYNVITPEQEEKDRNARSRYNGRLFLSWLQDVDDKWEKIKENMLLRHHNEAESLHAVQKMDWEWKLKEHALCEFKAKPVIDDTQVPIVHVSDDFDLLPA